MTYPYGVQTGYLPQSVLQFCVSVLGRLRDLQYIFAVTSGSPSTYQSQNLLTEYCAAGLEGLAISYFRMSLVKTIKFQQTPPAHLDFDIGKTENLK